MRSVICFVILLAMAVPASLSARYEQLSDYPFVLVGEPGTMSDPAVDDSLFNAASRGIRFEVNRTEMRADEPFAAIYTREIIPLLQRDDMVLKGLIVRGAASPEGGYDNNRRLGRERTARLVDFLTAQLTEQERTLIKDNLRTASITEDYQYLVELMQAAGDKDARLVGGIVEACGGDELRCKEALMALHGGRTWARLKEKYFARLRQARVLMWFVRKQDMIAAVQGMETTGIATDFFARELAAAAQATDTLTLRVPRLEYITETTRRHLIALRTNLLHDFFYMPDFGFAPSVNVQLEYYPLGGHFTYNLGFTWSNHRHWESQQFFQIRDLRLELRRYFKGGGVHRGLFIDAYAHGSIYGIGLTKRRGWQGEGAGGGLGLGYTLALNKQKTLRLEVSAQVGAFVTRYDPYVYGNPVTGTEDGDYYYDYVGNASRFHRRNHQWFWLGPTNAGIHITYDIIYRKRKHKVLGVTTEKGGEL